MPSVDSQTARRQARAAFDELIQFVDGPLAALEPAKLYQAALPGEWTLMENLSHIIEFLPYWAAECTRLAAEPGRLFGRTIDDAGRLNGIHEHARDSLSHTRAALLASYTPVDQVLASLNDEDLAIVGHHRKHGDQTMARFINEFITDHLLAHLAQMRQVLAALQG